MAVISGTASKKYLKNSEPNARKKVFLLVLPILIGSVSAIKTKFTILKIVPRIKPLPKGFLSGDDKKKTYKDSE